VAECGPVAISHLGLFFRTGIQEELIIAALHYSPMDPVLELSLLNAPSPAIRLLVIWRSRLLCLSKCLDEGPLSPFRIMCALPAEPYPNLKFNPRNPSNVMGSA
jgi:hypothetical protein